MKVLVDTTVWSIAFRRRREQAPSPQTIELAELIRDGRAHLIGPIRQEILSGIKTRQQFETLRERLRAFPDVPIGTDDFEMAAEISNKCRTAGVQGSAVDFLICAVAVRRKLAIWSTDQDFGHYARVVDLSLYPSRSK